MHPSAASIVRAGFVVLFLVAGFLLLGWSILSFRTMGIACLSLVAVIAMVLAAVTYRLGSIPPRGDDTET